MMNLWTNILLATASIKNKIYFPIFGPIEIHSIPSKSPGKSGIKYSEQGKDSRDGIRATPRVREKDNRFVVASLSWTYVKSRPNLYLNRCTERERETALIRATQTAWGNHGKLWDKKNNKNTGRVDGGAEQVTITLESDNWLFFNDAFVLFCKYFNLNKSIYLKKKFVFIFLINKQLYW
jgi:hypothetical protein